jgi:hypothetical protein
VTFTKAFRVTTFGEINHIIHHLEATPAAQQSATSQAMIPPHLRKKVTAQGTGQQAAIQPVQQTPVKQTSTQVFSEEHKRGASLVPTPADSAKDEEPIAPEPLQHEAEARATPSMSLKKNGGLKTMSQKDEEEPSILMSQSLQGESEVRSLPLILSRKQLIPNDKKKLYTSSKTLSTKRWRASSPMKLRRSPHLVRSPGMAENTSSSPNGTSQCR